MIRACALLLLLAACGQRADKPASAAQGDPAELKAIAEANTDVAAAEDVR